MEFLLSDQLFLEMRNLKKVLLDQVHFDSDKVAFISFVRIKTSNLYLVLRKNGID